MACRVELAMVSVLPDCKVFCTGVIDFSVGAVFHFPKLEVHIEISMNIKVDYVSK